MVRTRGYTYQTLCVLLLLLPAAFALSLAIGRVALPFSELLHGLAAPKPNLAWLILAELRIPRTVLALVVGATLGLGGAALQGLLRNPLAEPGLLGVSGGAALGAVIAIYFGLAAAFVLAIPLLGIAGALAAGALTFLFGRSGTLTLILAGAAVSGLAGAGLALALNFAPSPYAAYEITTWLLGSVAERDWAQIALCMPFILAGWLCLAFTPRGLDLLTLGEAQAESLGVNLSLLRAQVLAGVALSVGAATAMAGAIGFVGLVAPHLVRPFVGHQPSRILLPSALFGALLLLVTDIAIRVLPTSNELKLGVLTSLIGTPFFFWLVLHLRRLSP
ncbi:MAG: ABC transporter permease [Thiobacillus sp. 65-69]|nr:iron ABC transporter permease [Thiobacillus sp.]ODU90922.1 MAG: ABC transporter permease [Thiobacillus sp. SCN 65-179]OJW35652.1 MAG: ABC transporter permease [Thiobacillus sp. 65-69]